MGATMRHRCRNRAAPRLKRINAHRKDTTMTEQAYTLYNRLCLAAYRARDDEPRRARCNRLMSRAWRRYSRRWNRENAFMRGLGY